MRTGKPSCASTKIRILELLLVGSTLTTCATPGPYHADQPAESWAAECVPQDIPSMTNWVVLQCSFKNRSDQTIPFQTLDEMEVDQKAWRRPTAEELAKLKNDLRGTHQPLADLPLMFNGSSSASVEGFVAQLVVVSGLWISQSAGQEPKMDPANSDHADVKAGATVHQSFVLYKDRMKNPKYLILSRKGTPFSKKIPIPEEYTVRKRGQQAEK